MMKSTLKGLLLVGAAWGLTAQAGEAAPAATAAATAADNGGITEVLVTARRRDEMLKNVPISETVYSADKLDLSGARTITDLQKTTPNMTLQVSRGTNSTLTAFIRGVGQQDPLWGFEPGVGLYIDDVYVARPQGAVLDIFDVKAVEILRGPQGTLYGRNTIGGAIKYVTADIGDKPELELRGAVGSFREHDEIISAKTPLGDKFAASFAVAKYDHNGWGKNLVTGAQTNNKNVLAGRLTLEFKPTDTLFFRLSADQTNDNSNTNNGHREAQFVDAALAETWNVLPGKYDTQSGAGDRNRVMANGVSLLGRWAVNDAVTLKSITAYRSGKTDTTIDFDGTTRVFLDIPGQYRDHQFTEELQLLYSGQKLHGALGYFYLNATSAGAFDTDLGYYLSPTGLPFSILTNGYVRTSSNAVFGDVSYDVTERFQLSAGARWTQDDKTGHAFRQYYLGMPSPYFGNAAATAYGAPRTNYTNSAVFSQITPSVRATFKVTGDLTAYFNWGDGFKSGGFDMRGDAVAYPATVKGYKPETVTSTELGLKGSAFDHRLSFTTDIFNMDYRNQQVTTQYPGTSGIASVVDNVGAGRLRGWEGEAQLRATDALTLSGQAGYIDSAYTKWTAYIPVGTPGATCTGYCDVSQQRNFQNTPRWTYALSGTYTWNLGDHGKVRLIPTAAYRGAVQFSETRTPLLDQPGYFLYDADLVWVSNDNHYEVGLHGKNLADQRFRVGGYNFPGAAYGNSITGFYGPPRTILLTGKARF